uniref:Thaumatin-like protein n=1 Tax=Timema monikensis TaxID=170555 RepID=A0A7R9HSM0_9NEOP|nr:unnamed protein product [Timema monikensis]
MGITIYLVVCLLGAALGKQFQFHNNLGQTIWVGSLGNAGVAAPNNGGFQLNAGAEVSVTTDDGWAGRFWARTGCNFNSNGIGPCETGDCGNKLQCAGAGGVPPVSLAEFTLNGYGGVDYYDLSLVDGYNVPVQVIPLTKSVDPNNKYSCGSATCTAYLNNNCPNELRETNSAGATVACKSACLAFNTDQYCCRGNFGTPQTCTPSTWAQNYPAYFKNNCPGAYSYAYDDVSSTYTCQDSGYKIIFG